MRTKFKTEELELRDVEWCVHVCWMIEVHHQILTINMYMYSIDWLNEWVTSFAWLICSTVWFRITSNNQQTNNSGISCHCINFIYPHLVFWLSSTHFKQQQHNNQSFNQSFKQSINQSIRSINPLIKQLSLIDQLFVLKLMDRSISILLLFSKQLWSRFASNNRLIINQFH